MARAVEMWNLVLAGSLLAGAGCSREEASTTSAATSAASAPPVAPAATDLVGYVATYPTMEPQPGRRRLAQQFAVYQSADATSKELARLDSGAVVDLKASYQDWMLVAFQSGGQPTLGWIELKVTDSRATAVTDAEPRPAAASASAAPKTADAGAPTAGGTGTDAGTTGSGTTPDAGATGSSTTPDAGTTGGADAGATGSGTTPDAGAADGGARRKIILKKP